MRRKPIKVEHRGCGCSVIFQELGDDYDFNGCGVHFYILRIDDKGIDLNDTTVKEIKEKYRKEFEDAEVVEIKKITPLHDETYELCKESNQFLLVEQGNGYA